MLEARARRLEDSLQVLTCWTDETPEFQAAATELGQHESSAAYSNSSGKIKHRFADAQ